MTGQEIINTYLEGKSINAISREQNIPYGRIQKILRDNKITIRGGRKKKELSEDDLKQFSEDFRNGMIYYDLEKKYHLEQTTLRRIAQENNLERKNHNKINKRIKSDYFSQIDSPEKAYWIGVLFTDGSVNRTYRSENSSSRIRLQLQENDKELLEQFKEDLCIDSKLIYDKRENKHCYSVEFVDNQIFDDLSKFGIIPNKTYQIKNLMYKDIPQEYLPSYILGLFDGDGCLTYSKDFSTDATISFTTYYESIALDFQKLIDELINKENHNKPTFTTSWHVNWRGRLQCLKILDILYENCPRHLERKYQKYLQLKNSLN